MNLKTFSKYKKITIDTWDLYPESAISMIALQLKQKGVKKPKTTAKELLNYYLDDYKL